MKHTLISMATLAAMATVLPCIAQSYPVKPVRFIVPFPPGGPTDILGRLISERLTRTWNVQVVADNRAGAGGNIGTELCTRSPPDGYTMCMFTVAQSISPSVYSKLAFDPVKDLAPVTLVAILPSLLMVHPSVPARNVQQLVALAKARPGQLTYASTGNGTSPHMLMEMLKSMTGTQLVHVPYKGAAPAMIDQMSGQIEVAFSTAIAALPFVQQGKVRALAVSTIERFPPTPDLPTVSESGVKGFDGSSWQGIAMPAGTPKDIVAKMHQELATYLKMPETKQRLLEMGGLASGITPEDFATFIRTETEKWAKVARYARVRLD